VVERWSSKKHTKYVLSGTISGAGSCNVLVPVNMRWNLEMLESSTRLCFSPT